jgi:hypothetical protein
VHFVDGEIGRGGRVCHHRPSPRRQPLRDDSIVLGPTIGTLMLPEIDVPTTDRNDRLAGWFVESV